MQTIKIYKSSATNMPIEDNSVHSIITSPPYWAKRVYDGEQKQIWGGDSFCDHNWVDGRRAGMSGGTKSRVLNSRKLGTDGTLNFQIFGESKFSTCSKCNAWHGALGLEPDIKAYIRSIAIDIGNELKRVLHPSGIFWLNLGDGFAANRSYQVNDSKWSGVNSNTFSQYVSDGLKPKDLIGIPWRVAFALQEQGWWLRVAIPWLKNNAMPHPVMDRPVISHEYWFMFTKSEKYFYDTYSVLQKSAYPEVKPGILFGGKKYLGTTINPTYSGNEYDPNKHEGRRWRTGDVFLQSFDQYLLYLNHIKDNNEGMLFDVDGNPLAMIYNPAQYKGTHYATFNPKMIEPLVLCSTSQYGVCSMCGNPYTRDKYPKHQEWLSTCKHNSESVPATVLDPFCGTGSTLFTAHKLGRDTIGCDVSDKYIGFTRDRLGINKMAQWESD